MTDYADGEIVARLRHFGKLFGYDVKPLFEDAANEIERLRFALEECCHMAGARTENDAIDWLDSIAAFSLKTLNGAVSTPLTPGEKK